MILNPFYLFGIHTDTSHFFNVLMAKTKRPIGTNPAHTYQVFAFTSLSITAVSRHVPLQVYQAYHTDNLLLFFRERGKSASLTIEKVSFVCYTRLYKIWKRVLIKP